jgi:hypothetical protein
MLKVHRPSVPPERGGAGTATRPGVDIDLERAPVVFGWLLYRQDCFADAVHLETVYRLDRVGIAGPDVQQRCNRASTTARASRCCAPCSACTSASACRQRRTAATGWDRYWSPRWTSQRRPPCVRPRRRRRARHGLLGAAPALPSPGRSHAACCTTRNAHDNGHLQGLLRTPRRPALYPPLHALAGCWRQTFTTGMLIFSPRSFHEQSGIVIGFPMAHADTHRVSTVPRARRTCSRPVLPRSCGIARRRFATSSGSRTL